MKLEEYSETLAHKFQKPGNRPKERTELLEHGESLKSVYDIEGRTQVDMR